MCDRSTAVVCGPTSYFPDDVHGVCSSCSSPVVWRPHAPAVRKICVACHGRELWAAHTEGKPIYAHVTPAVVQDLVLYLARPAGQPS